MTVVNRSGAEDSSVGGAAHEPPKLPEGWVATVAPDGGVYFRVSPKGRNYLVAGVFAVALGWTGVTAYSLAAQVVPPLGVSPFAAISISILLFMLAVWCAFGDEMWYVRRDLLEHRVGIGTWQHVRAYRGAEIEVIGRFNRYGEPYFRIYASSGGAARFVIERNNPELAGLARFIAYHTGWQVRHEIQPFGGARRRVSTRG